MKNNKGRILGSVIIITLIFILIAFLLYEVVYIDIFDIMPKEQAIIANSNNINDTIVENNINNNIVSNSLSNNIQNVESIEPILDNNMRIYTNLVSDEYYYNQLDEYAKKIYDGLEENKENMKSGVYTIKFGTEFNDLLNSNNGEQKLNLAFQSAWNAYTYDNMDIFYIDVEKLTLMTTTTTIGNFSTHSVELSKGNNSSYLKSNFLSSSKLNGKINLLEAMKKEINRQLEGNSDYNKIKKVHDWLINNIEYDINLESEEPYSICGH